MSFGIKLFLYFPGLLVLALLLIRLRHRHSWLYLVFFSLFYVYLLMVIDAIAFPIYLPDHLGLRMPAADILARANLVPFNFYWLSGASAGVILTEIGGNLLITLPIGFGAPWLVRIRGWWAPLIALGLGLTFEVSQLVLDLALGGVYRSVDINDVILNACGFGLGYGLYWVTEGVSRVLLRRARSRG